MTRRERELIVWSLRARADTLGLVRKYEGAAWFKVTEADATIQELRTLASQVESGQNEEETKLIIEALRGYQQWEMEESSIDLPQFGALADKIEGKL